jgi:hypothetical protein
MFEVFVKRMYNLHRPPYCNWVFEPPYDCLEMLVDIQRIISETSLHKRIQTPIVKYLARIILCTPKKKKSSVFSRLWLIELMKCKGYIKSQRIASEDYHIHSR